MENLIFSLNATVPVFLMMVLGLVFRKLGWIDDVFASKMNKFVFLVPLPVLVFEDLATVDFSEVWDLKFVLFCFAATLISIGSRRRSLSCGEISPYRGSSSRRPTGAARPSLGSRSSRISMGMQGWRRL